MARPTEQLIEAMLRTSDSIEMGTVRYEWNEQENCNCGLLSRCILNEPNGDKFFNDVSDEVATMAWVWSDFGDQVARCLKTGFPLGRIATSLLAAGLEPDDFYELETLDNLDICLRAGLSYPNRDDPSAITRYLRAWAAMLRAELDAKKQNVAVAAGG